MHAEGKVSTALHKGNSAASGKRNYLALGFVKNTRARKIFSVILAKVEVNGKF